MAGAECVSAPTERNETPGRANSRMFESLSPPETSITGGLLPRRTVASRFSTRAKPGGVKLSSRMRSTSSAAASSASSSVRASTTIGSPLSAARARATASVRLPATRMWFSLISTVSKSP